MMTNDDKWLLINKKNVNWLQVNKYLFIWSGTNNILGDMKMKQVLICLEQKNGLKLDVLTAKQRELVALGTSLIAGNTHSISHHVKNALDEGATKNDILKVASFAIGNTRLLLSIIELLRALEFEENDRKSYISIIEDCREDWSELEKIREMPNNKRRTKHMFSNDTDSKQTCEIIDYLCKENAKNHR